MEASAPCRVMVAEPVILPEPIAASRLRMRDAVRLRSRDEAGPRGPQTAAQIERPGPERHLPAGTSRPLWPNRAVDQIDVALGSPGTLSASAADEPGQRQPVEGNLAADLRARARCEPRLNLAVGDLAADVEKGRVALPAERHPRLHGHRRRDARAVAEQEQERRDVGRLDLGLAAIHHIVVRAQREGPRGR